MEAGARERTKRKLHSPIVRLPLQHCKPREHIPKTLSRGWRQSLRNGSWYRRCAGWVAIVTVDTAGYRVVLKRVERTLDDALNAINAILKDQG